MGLRNALPDVGIPLPKSNGGWTDRSDSPIVGDQVAPKRLVEVHAETGHTIFTEDTIGPDEIAYILRLHFVDEFFRHFPGTIMPGVNANTRVGQSVPEKKYKLVFSGTERTYSPRALFNRIKLMAARYCSALDGETLMVPRSVVSGTTTSVGVPACRKLIKVMIKHAQQLRRSTRKTYRLLAVRWKSGTTSRKKEKMAGPLKKTG